MTRSETKYRSVPNIQKNVFNVSTSMKKTAVVHNLFKKKGKLRLTLLNVESLLQTSATYT